MQKTFIENTSQTTLDSVMQEKSTQKTYKTLTSWLEDSHVRAFLMQEREEGLMTPEERYFLKSQGFLETKNPNIFYSKTFQVYYLTTKDVLSRKSLGFSPKKGIMFNGRLLIPKTVVSLKTDNGSILKDFLERERDSGEVLSHLKTNTKTNARQGKVKEYVLNRSSVFVDKDNVCCTLNAQGQQSRNRILINEIVECRGSTQKNASKTDETYSPTLTQAMGTGGGHIPMITFKEVDDERCIQSTKNGDFYALTTSQRGMPFIKKQDNYILTKDDKVLYRNNTKKGYLEAEEGDGLEIGQKNGRGLVQPQSSPTLNCSGNTGVLLKDGNYYKIRRLTPIECERLQGFPDNWTKEGYDGSPMSDTQRYKMCGNAVTTNVITNIFDNWDLIES